MFDYEGSRAEFLKLLAELGEEPAFVHRARVANDATEELYRHCQARRDDLLQWPRKHLTALAERVQPDWSRLACLLADDKQALILCSLHQAWGPLTSRAGKWAWSDRQTLMAFLQSANRFNSAWRRYLEQLDLGPVNRLRRNYNEFYPLEKATAFGNEHAIVDFVPLELVTIEQLRERFPLIVLPALK